MRKVILLTAILFLGLSRWAQTVLSKWTFEGVTATNSGTTPTIYLGSSSADAGVLTAGSAFTANHTPPPQVHGANRQGTDH